MKFGLYIIRILTNGCNRSALCSPQFAAFCSTLCEISNPFFGILVRNTSQFYTHYNASSVAYYLVGFYHKKGSYHQAQWAYSTDHPPPRRSCSVTPIIGEYFLIPPAAMSTKNLARSFGSVILIWRIASSLSILLKAICSAHSQTVFCGIFCGSLVATCAAVRGEGALSSSQGRFRT